MDKKYAEFLLNKTREDYNLISEDFSRTRNFIPKEFEFLFDYAKKEEKVLDLGCGSGRFYRILEEKNTEYTGVDNSEKLITIAKNKYPEADFRVATAARMPFEDNHFDKIFSIAVLHHIPSKELRLKFLNEAKRVLKKDGLLILTVWKFWRKEECLRFIKYSILKMIGKSKLDFNDVFEPWGKKTERYYHWFSKKELEKLARESGFKIKEAGFTKNEKGNRQNIYAVLEK